MDLHAGDGLDCVFIREEGGEVLSRLGRDGSRQQHKPYSADFYPRPTPPLPKNDSTKINQYKSKNTATQERSFVWILDATDNPIRREGRNEGGRRAEGLGFLVRSSWTLDLSFLPYFFRLHLSASSHLRNPGAGKLPIEPLELRRLASRHGRHGARFAAGHRVVSERSHRPGMISSALVHFLNVVVIIFV